MKHLLPFFSILFFTFKASAQARPYRIDSTTIKGKVFVIDENNHARELKVIDTLGIRIIQPGYLHYFLLPGYNIPKRKEQDIRWL